jgi:hypothetical protein
MSAVPQTRKFFVLNGNYQPGELKLGGLINTADGSAQIRVTSLATSQDPAVRLAGKVYVAHIATNKAGVTTGEHEFELRGEKLHILGE